jgi:hypothetical protein
MKQDDIYLIASNLRGCLHGLCKVIVTIGGKESAKNLMLTEIKLNLNERDMSPTGEITFSSQERGCIVVRDFVIEDISYINTDSNGLNCIWMREGRLPYKRTMTMDHINRF